MKLFWAIICLFAIAAVVVLAAQMRSSAPPAPEQPRVQASPRSAQPLRAAESGGAALRDGAAQDEARALAEDLLASSTSGNRTGSAEHEHATPAESFNPWQLDDDTPTLGGGAPQPRLEHSIVEQEDGSLLLDDTFVVRGSGTAADPYEVTWDLLMSAAETYQPRLGMSDIPERVAMFDGAHVRIAGYLMFPMTTGQADELLVMLNMWDGCCIGTMPSPFDAIEVQLSAPAAAGNQQLFNYGSLEGKLIIDPYLINDWLIGLYVMEDASLSIGM